MNIYDTYYMLAAVEEVKPEHTFFKRRYFPTDMAMDVFGTSQVLADYKNTTQKRAPFVLPRIGAVPVGREGFDTYALEPANISLSMPLTLDHLKNRGFGESLMSQLTPAERAERLLMGDLTELNARITRSEEVLAINTMLTNGSVMQHQTDKEGVYEEIGVKFYDGENNPAQFTPTGAWTHSKKNADGTWTMGSWYHDICAMAKMLTSRGLPARDALLAQDLGEFIMYDPWVMAALDNRRMELGRIEPTELTEYVTDLGVLNFGGRKLELLVSDGTYEADGEDIPYIPDSNVIITAPNCGRGLYGAVTQMESDGEYHTHAGTRVPQHIWTMRPPTKEVQLTSRPLFVPNRVAPWSTAKVELG